MLQMNASLSGLVESLIFGGLLPFFFPFEHFSKTIIAVRCLLVYIKRVYFFKLFFKKKKHFETALLIAA